MRRGRLTPKHKCFQIMLETRKVHVLSYSAVTSCSTQVLVLWLGFGLGPARIIFSVEIVHTVLRRMPIAVLLTDNQDDNL